MVRRLEVHEACQIVPSMTDEEYARTRESIREHGQLKPIELLGGKILDGRHRYEACIEIGKEPSFIDLPDDTDPWVYVRAVNIERRQLPLHAGQRAMIAAQEYEYERSCGKKITVKLAADRYITSEPSVKTCIRIVKFGSQALNELVQGGALGSTRADSLVQSEKLSRQEKLDAIAEGPEAIVKAVKLSERRSRAAAVQGSEQERKKAKSLAEKEAEQPDVEESQEELEPDQPERKRATKPVPPATASPAAPAEAEPVAGEPWADSPIEDSTVDAEQPTSTARSTDLSDDQLIDLVLKRFDAIELIVRIVETLSLAMCGKALGKLKSVIVAKTRAEKMGMLLPYDAKAERLKGKLDCEEFQQVWNRWCDYRAEVHDALTEEEATAQIDVLKHKSLAIAIAALEVAMDEGKPELSSNYKAKRGAQFVPPTVAQVEAFVDEKGICVDAKEFVNHYASQGWKLSNGNPMTDWRLAVQRKSWASGGASSPMKGGYEDDPARYDPSRRQKEKNYGKL